MIQRIVSESFTLFYSNQFTESMTKLSLLCKSSHAVIFVEFIPVLIVLCSSSLCTGCDKYSQKSLSLFLSFFPFSFLQISKLLHPVKLLLFGECYVSDRWSLLPLTLQINISTVSRRPPLEAKYVNPTALGMRSRGQ